jgi:hypothetical protein
MGIGSRALRKEGIVIKKGRGKKKKKENKKSLLHKDTNYIFITQTL